jgi:hypothetical protein
MSVTVGPMGVLVLLARHGLLDSVDSACDFGAMEVDARDPAKNALFEELFRSRNRPFPPEFRDVASGRIYAIAGDFYRALGWGYRSYDIDQRFGSTYIDLNVDQVPASEHETYSLTMNIGTSEHVFNQHNFFLQFHNVTRVGGLMVHAVPLHNHGNHGLYVYTPTFFFSLAQYNGYEVLGAWQSGRPHSTVYPPALDAPEGRRVLLITVMRRLRPDAFAFPLQINEPMWPSGDAEARYGAFSRRPLEALRPRSGLPDRFYVELPSVTFHEGSLPRGFGKPGGFARAAGFARALVGDPRATLQRKLRSFRSARSERS